MNYEKFGFIKTCAVSPRLHLGDVQANVQEHIKYLESAKNEQASIVLFPELSLTGYTCGDLFQQDILIQDAWKGLKELVKYTEGIVAIIGLPIYFNSRLWNCVAVIANEDIMCIIPKSYLPNYKEYYEARWFHSGVTVNDTIKGIPFGTDFLFDVYSNNKKRVTFGIEICEDLWVPLPPSTLMALGGATLILNPSASTETVGKSEYRRELVSQQSSRCVLAYLYASSGCTESTTDVVFSGHCISAEYGTILKENSLYEREGSCIYPDFDINKIENERRKLTTFGDQVNLFESGQFGNKKFEHIALNTFVISETEFTRTIDAHPFVPSRTHTKDVRCMDIFNIQTEALITRLEACKSQKIVIGVSGGLDSTLALLVAVNAFKKMGRPMTDIIGITLPGFGTSERTLNNSIRLMSEFSITQKKIDITYSCVQHFADIKHDMSDKSVVFENGQARERTQILMDVANKYNGIVLGTGDLSESALGWSTYNGDHMSMYAINCSIPKTLVATLVDWISHYVFPKSRDTLQEICATPISPELLPLNDKGEIDQKTEDIIGPYELHDFFLYNHVRWNFTPEKILFLAMQANESFNAKYTEEVIKKWLNLFYKRFFTQQFKRSCVPDGPKVGSLSLSPRGDWRMPSDASMNSWILK